MTKFTKVEISFYMPMGFAYTYFIKTKDRGVAVKYVMNLHEAELRYVNAIIARYATPTERDKVISVD